LNGLKDPYRAVIMKSLAKDPEKRFSDVPQMMDALNGKTKIDEFNTNENSRVPPVQSMFIGEEFASDSEIRFGEVCESAIPDEVMMAASHRGFAGVIGGSKNNLPEEPIARAVTGGWNQVTDWWVNANMTTPVKVLILAGAGLLLLVNSPWVIPVSIGLGLLYLLYYTVRSLFQPGDVEKKPRVLRAERIDRIRRELGARPINDRVTEGVGSLVVSAVVCVVLGFFTLVASAESQSTQSQQWAFYAWTVVVAIVATWALLITNKTWEHRRGDPLIRRFVMLSVGMGVGLFAVGAAQFLHLDWSLQSWVGEPELSPFAANTFLNDGSPQLPGFVLFFSGLFLILRWWRQADPIRRTRLSIWSVGLCLVWGMLIGQFFQFPLPWSCVLAVMISVATQIASPWLSPDQRHQLLTSP